MFQRLKNLYFWSSISKEDVKTNPHSYHIRQANKEEHGEQAYIIGLNEEESAFNATLNVENKDTLLT